MRNIRKIIFGLLVLVVICNAQTVDSEEDNDYQLRASRRTKVSKKPSEKEVKKQTTPKKTQNTRNASQQQESALNNGLMANINMDHSNGLLPPLADRRFGTNGLELINQNVIPFMGQQTRSYATQFPYPVLSYPSPNFRSPNFPGHQPGFMGDFYGNPNVPQNDQYPVPSMPLGQNNLNFMSQNPLAPTTNLQSSFPQPYSGNFMVNGNSLATRIGLSNNIGIAEQPFLEPQLHPSGLQIPTSELQLQQGYMNPFANMFPQMLHQQIPQQNEFEMPITTFPLYPRLQRSLKSREDV